MLVAPTTLTGPLRAPHIGVQEEVVLVTGHPHGAEAPGGEGQRGGTRRVKRTGELARVPVVVGARCASPGGGGRERARDLGLRHDELVVLPNWKRGSLTEQEGDEVSFSALE